jgi:hypothetical protein
LRGNEQGGCEADMPKRRRRIRTHVHDVAALFLIVARQRPDTARPRPFELGHLLAIKLWRKRYSPILIIGIKQFWIA